MDNYAYAEPAVVYGIRVEDPRAAVLVKRVLNISLLSGVVGVCSSIYYNSQKDIPSNQTSEMKLGGIIFSILLALAVPACGYFGAKQRDKGLLTVFWVCNCIGSCCSLFSIGAIAAVGALTQQFKRCVCENAATPVYNPTSNKCVQGTVTYTCEEMQQLDFTGVYILYVSSAILGFLGCMYGRELAQTPMFVTMKTEYVANPVGTTSVDNVQSTDYAELK